MSDRQRGWLVALPVGVIVATIVYLLFKDAGSSSGVGPVKVLGVVCVFVATVVVALPRSVIRQRRSARALAAWSILMLFLMMAEAARQCSSSDPTCHGGGDPLRAFFLWAVGFAVLAVIWAVSAPRRPRRRRRRR